MKFVSRFVMAIGGLSAAAVALTVLSPKAHAVVATLVQVVNTRSTPVPNQDVDLPARHPYQQTCNTNGASAVSCAMPPVPANIEVVIQTVSMQINGAAPVISSLNTTGGGVSIFANIPLVGQAGPFYMTTQQTTQYVDPGTSASCSTNLATANPIAFQCSIAGYWVSLP
jgi:hypothetical protein